MQNYEAKKEQLKNFKKQIKTKKNKYITNQNFFERSCESMDIIFLKIKKILSLPKLSNFQKQQKIEKLFFSEATLTVKDYYNKPPMWHTELLNCFPDIMISKKHEFSNYIQDKFYKHLSENEILKFKTTIYENVVGNQLYDLSYYFGFFILIFYKSQNKTNKKISLDETLSFFTVQEDFLKTICRSHIDDFVKTIFKKRRIKRNLVQSILPNLNTTEYNYCVDLLESVLLQYVGQMFDVHKKDIVSLQNFSLKFFQNCVFVYKKKHKFFTEVFTKDIFLKIITEFEDLILEINAIKDLTFVFFKHILNYFVEQNFFILQKEKKLFIKLNNLEDTNKYKTLLVFNLDFNDNKQNTLDILIKQSLGLSLLPMICKPLDWKEVPGFGGLKGGLLSSSKLGLKLVHPLTEGLSSAFLSEETIDFVNNLQKLNCYRIDRDVLHFLKSDGSQKKKEIIYNLLGIPDDAYLNEKNLEFEVLVLQILNKMQNYDYAPYNHFKACLENIFKEDEFSSEPAKQKLFKISLEALEKLNKECLSYSFSLENLIIWSQQTTNLEDKTALEKVLKKKFISLNLDYLKYIDLHDKVMFLLQELNSIYSKKLLYNWIINIAETYVDFDLYFSCFFDFRGRIYPLGLLSRLAGIFKWLLIQVQGERLDQNGLKYLTLNIASFLKLQCSTLDELYEIFNLKIYCRLDLSKSFEDNLDEIYNIILEYKVADSLGFFSSLKEWFYFHNNPKHICQILLNYDQSSSGPQILALLSKSYDDLFITNILSGKYKQDIYDVVKKGVLKFCETICDTQTLKKLKTVYTRKLAKKQTMIIFYGSKFSILRQNLNQIFKLHEIQDPIVNGEKISLSNEILKYMFNTLLVNKPFSGIMGMYRFISSIPKLFDVDQKQGFNLLIIETFDNNAFEYKYIKTNVFEYLHKLKISKKSFKQQTFALKNFTAFAPNLIHSIDGTIVRLVFKKIKGTFFCDPIHDCFRVHPNNITKLLDIWKEVYIQNFNKDTKHIFKQLVGRNMRTGVFDVKFNPPQSSWDRNWEESFRKADFFATF